jgi:hypothetical protein
MAKKIGWNDQARADVLTIEILRVRNRKEAYR